jgi:hypothetical protein
MDLPRLETPTVFSPSERVLQECDVTEIRSVDCLGVASSELLNPDLVGAIQPTAPSWCGDWCAPSSQRALSVVGRVALRWPTPSIVYYI